MRWLLLVFALLSLPALAEVRDPYTHFLHGEDGRLQGRAGYRAV
jgi:hypothetical protein